MLFYNTFLRIVFELNGVILETKLYTIATLYFYITCDYNRINYREPVLVYYIGSACLNLHITILP